jgi:hypothetical protein
MAALCNYLVFGMLKLLSQLIPNFGKSSTLIWKQRNFKILSLSLSLYLEEYLNSFFQFRTTAKTNNESLIDLFPFINVKRLAFIYKNF